jgi:hypothetical protein
MTEFEKQELTELITECITLDCEALKAAVKAEKLENELEIAVQRYVDTVKSNEYEYEEVNKLFKEIDDDLTTKFCEEDKEFKQAYEEFELCRAEAEAEARKENRTLFEKIRDWFHKYF